MTDKERETLTNELWRETQIEQDHICLAPDSLDDDWHNDYE